MSERTRNEKNNISRKEFGKRLAGGLGSAALYSLLPGKASAREGVKQATDKLPPWRGGYLDIHHINTGKGDSTFFIFPDGTTFLLDAGAQVRERPAGYDSPQRPDSSYRPGQWIARYIKTFHPEGKNGALDYAAITHFHMDHMGAVTKDSPKDKSGTYQLTGITDVGEKISIRTMIDRDWSDYSYPRPLEKTMIDNYREFLQWHIKHKSMDVQQFIVGRNNQIKLVHNPDKYSNFEVQNIAANGDVWTGTGTGTGTEFRNRFPDNEEPSENNYSLAIRLTYGDFTYFSGGDLTGATSSGAPAWHDMESAIAWVVGPVDVQALNHHGFKDSTNAFFLSVLQPRVLIDAVSATSHPGPDVMKRMLCTNTYPGPSLLMGCGRGAAPIWLTCMGKKRQRGWKRKLIMQQVHRGM